MLRTSLKEQIYDLMHKYDKASKIEYASCLIKKRNRLQWVAVPYSAIEWVSED